MTDTPADVVDLPPAPQPGRLVPEGPELGNKYAIIIDNGSTNLRYGYNKEGSYSNGPHERTNVAARFKDRRTNRPVLLFGDCVEADSGGRAQARYPWEGDVLLNFDALESALDHVFVHLGVSKETVDHPILMSERLCSPLHSRALTSELMFELYSVPSLTYSVDSIMSFYNNNVSRTPTSSTSLPTFRSDGLVVSFNTASTSVIPILSGKGILSHSKRIPWGASQATEYLHKLLSLKYPGFPSRVNVPPSSVNQRPAKWMFQNLCEFSPDYISHLRKLKDPNEILKVDKIVRFPFTEPTQTEKTVEELEQAYARRKEQGKKLQEIAAARRSEKLLEKENDLQRFLELREDRSKGSKRDWEAKLEQEGFDDEAALESIIKRLETDLKRSRKKEVDEEDVAEEPSFPLLDVPDEELDEAGLKEKKKQRLLKAGFDARLKVRREKEKEKEEREAEERRDNEERERNPEGWALKLREEHESAMLRIKERTRRKAALSDRKSAVSQARMKTITTLAADDRVPKKRRKANGEDMFGADDADWAVYRKINAAAVSSDEEEDFARLDVVEKKLLTHDPTFSAEHTFSSINSKRSALISAFKQPYAEHDVEGTSRVHFNIERWRACETWFSPGMAGVDSAGLGEIIQNVLARCNEEERGRLVKNVFVTGAPAQLPGLKTRLYNAMRPILSPEMPIEIHLAQRPAIDAWRGMAHFSRTEEFRKVGVSKAEYEEWGGERIRRWWGGNWNSSFIPDQ